MSKIKKVKIFINQNDKSRVVANQLKKELIEYQFEIVENNYDLAISVGGDGSFLRMVRDSEFNENIYYIGINSGSLGFLQEIDIDHTIDFVQRLCNDDYKIEDISIQETKIITNNQIYEYQSLNEIVVRNKDFNVLKVPVFVDDEFLEQFSGDGILFSTSTGTTAYNMSFGGSIVYNTLDTLSITPIAPLNNKVYKTLPNSVIIPCNKMVSFEGSDDLNLFIQIDGVNHMIDHVKKLETKVGNKNIHCIRMNDFHFIKVLNNKMLEK